MEIEHISVSRSDCYRECPYKYRLKYHDKVPSPLPEQFYFTYGKIIHKIAEVCVVENGSRPIKEVAKDVLEGRIAVEGEKKAPPLPPDYKSRLPGHLKALERLNKGIGYSGITEFKFKYDLEVPNGKMVTGFIDRIVIKEDMAFVIDYKTTKAGPYRDNKESVKKNKQLRIYSRVVQREFGFPPERIRAGLYYLEGEESVGSSYTGEALDAVESELLGFYNSIKSHKPEEAFGKVGNHCNRCEYRDMCPFFKNSRKKYAWDGNLSSLPD